MLIQKHLTKIHHWQQVLEDINVQHKKPTELPQGPLAFLEQASANIPAPMKPNWSMCRDPEHYPDCVSGDTLSLCAQQFVQQAFDVDSMWCFCHVMNIHDASRGAKGHYCHISHEEFVGLPEGSHSDKLEGLWHLVMYPQHT